MGARQSSSSSSRATSPPPSPPPPPGWANLLPELLDLVLRRLPSLADRYRFAAVCRHWLRVATRYSAPLLPRALPWLHFHGDGCSFRSLPDGERHSFLHLQRKHLQHAACDGSSGCWLLFVVEEQEARRHLLLMNPLRTRNSCIMRIPRRCREPVAVDRLTVTDAAAGAPPSSAGAGGSRSTDFVIVKVVVCSEADLVIATVNYRRSSSDVVVCCRCRPGQSSSPSWSTGISTGVLYQDMALYKGKVYTVTWDGELFAHQLITGGNNSRQPRFAPAERLIQAPPTPTQQGSATLCRGMTCFLVVSAAADSDSKLLMVRWIIPLDRYTSEDSTGHMTLRVFEADFGTSRWREVKSLGDQVLFVSPGSSRAISVSAATHGDGLQGNRIYFVGDNNWYWRRWRPSSRPRNCGVYDMSSDTIQSISLGQKHVVDHQVEASWFFPHG